MSWGKNLTGFGPHTTGAKNVSLQTANAAKQMAETEKKLEADGFTRTAHDEWTKTVGPDMTPKDIAKAIGIATGEVWPTAPKPAPKPWPTPAPVSAPAPTPATKPSPAPWPNPTTPEPSAPVTDWKPTPLPAYGEVPETGPKDYYVAYSAGVSYVVLSGPYVSIEDCEKHYDAAWARFMEDKVMELPFPVAKRKRENLYVCAIKAGSRRTGSYGKLKA